MGGWVGGWGGAVQFAYKSTKWYIYDSVFLIKQ